MLKKYSNFIFTVFGFIFFFINCFLKYPHINKDGLLYINDSLKFSGDFSNFYELYGLPLYSIILYYINIFFKNFSLSSYFINFVSYLILVIYISKIVSLFSLKNNQVIILSTLLIFGISTLMSNYLGLTIRDYLGWSFLIMSFYYILSFAILKNSKYLAFFLVSHLFASMFRIEYIFILPFILIYLYLTNKHLKINNNIYILLLFLIIGLLFFSSTSLRLSEIIFHFDKFSNLYGSFSIGYLINSFIIIVGKIGSLFLPFVILVLCFDYFKFKNNSNLKEYYKLTLIYSLFLIIINYIYLLNIKITSARYFIPILVLLMPLLSFGLSNFYISRKKHKRFFLLGILISLLLLINVNKNYQYKNSSILDIKSFIERENINLGEIYFEDNRLLFYFGKIELDRFRFDLNLFCNSEYKYFLITHEQYSLIKDLKNFSAINDTLIHNKYKLIKKINDC